MEIIGEIISDVLTHPQDRDILKQAKIASSELCEAFPLYQSIGEGSRN